MSVLNTRQETVLNHLHNADFFMDDEFGEEFKRVHADGSFDMVIIERGAPDVLVQRYNRNEVMTASQKYDIHHEMNLILSKV